MLLNQRNIELVKEYIYYISHNEILTIEAIDYLIEMQATIINECNVKSVDIFMILDYLVKNEFINNEDKKYLQEYYNNIEAHKEHKQYNSDLINTLSRYYTLIDKPLKNNDINDILNIYHCIETSKEPLKDIRHNIEYYYNVVLKDFSN